MKRCPRCERHLPLESFYRSPGKKDGRSAHCAECNRKRYADNSEEVLLRQKLAMYGLTRADCDALVIACDNKCSICHQPERTKLRGKTKRLTIDHCHQTGKVRGLLCSDCNQALGQMEDDPERLIAAAEYLEQHAASPRLFVVRE